MRGPATLACLLLAAGCDDPGPGERQPTRLPAVQSFGGPVMAHPQLVPIFYSDDPDADTLTRFSQWLVTSSWLTEVGSEYGVGPGSVLGVVHKTEPAPDRITDPQIVDLLFQGLADGTLPQPGDGLGEVIFVVYVPSHTVVTVFTSDTSCVDFGGYHLSARRNGVELAYAVIPACPNFIRGLTDVEGRQFAASHEIIEAATDPIPVNHPGFQLRDPAGAWSGLGQEVADLCTRSDDTGAWREAGFVAQRSWSNAAAAVGDPCVPVATDAPYFNVVVERSTLPRIAPGDHEVLGLTGWATGATPDWMLSASSAKPVDAQLTLASNRMFPGRTTTLNVSVPTTTAPGTTLQLFVYSGLSQTSYHVLPMLALIGAPCSSFTSCEACSSRVGCGFCTTTGRCEAEGTDGSAESACPASSFARWPGSCRGFCASHNGSCSDCSSQAGCGWCSSGGATQCLEASHDNGHPEAASCAYADWSFTPEYCSQ